MESSREHSSGVAVARVPYSTCIAAQLRPLGVANDPDRPISSRLSSAVGREKKKK
eukprot:CAMPEP_0195006658 /NCGR_PEP_ID=MMETSP0326_2-20130528/6906_1 /TAXON_ID=2866 ORGANISM="Crypthecodinium cohnii, Strain Seligo" /NCGR_SAMPLE_ID=MMETSP0326_2 /ASSEMBLY_ACC=CAM_ASM_000348 /LENGTH=54 /DNA_ID=CAMNT_0040013543 /DNA_START=60 /DNA_END=221 /DNA_ORIENTATION=+